MWPASPPPCKWRASLGSCAARFFLTTLLLGVWIGAAEFNALGGDHRLFGVSALTSTIATHAFALWLLGFVAVLALALALISARPLAARREREARVTMS